MPSFLSLNQMYEYVKKQTLNVFRNEMAKIIKETLEKYVQEEVYNYSQGSYQRTMDLLNSIEIFDYQQINNNKYEINIGWSWEAFASHTTILGGSGYSAGDNIPVALVAYSLENDYTWNRTGTDFMELTYQELEVAHKCIEIIKQELKKKGIDVI